MGKNGSVCGACQTGAADNYGRRLKLSNGSRKKCSGSGLVLAKQGAAGKQKKAEVVMAGRIKMGITCFVRPSTHGAEVQVTHSDP